MLRHVMMFCAVAVFASLAITRVMPDASRPVEKDSPVAAAVETKKAAKPLSGQFAIGANAQGHYESDFRLNGVNVRAMIDTGATLVAINESTARRVGLRLGRADFSGKVQTANGEARAAAVTLDSLQIGAVRVHDVEAVVLEDKALKGALVGMSFLNRLKGYQAADNRLLLTQ